MAVLFTGLFPLGLFQDLGNYGVEEPQPFQPLYILNYEAPPRPVMATPASISIHTPCWQPQNSASTPVNTGRGWRKTQNHGDISHVSQVGLLLLNGPFHMLLAMLLFSSLATVSFLLMSLPHHFLSTNLYRTGELCSSTTAPVNLIESEHIHCQGHHGTQFYRMRTTPHNL